MVSAKSELTAEAILARCHVGNYVVAEDVGPFTRYTMADRSSGRLDPKAVKHLIETGKLVIAQSRSQPGEIWYRAYQAEGAPRG